LFTRSRLIAVFEINGQHGEADSGQRFEDDFISFNGIVEICVEQTEIGLIEQLICNRIVIRVIFFETRGQFAVVYVISIIFAEESR